MTVEIPPLNATFDQTDLMAMLTGAAGLDTGAHTDDPAATLEEVGLDSLAFLALQTELQDRFGIELPDEVTAEATFAEMVGQVRAALGGPAATSEEGTAARTDNSIELAAPFDLVWDRTNDVPEWPYLFSEYARAEVLRQDGDTVTFRLTMHPDENGIEWSWVSERVLDRAAGHVRARRVETGPFEFMTIEWFYTPTPTGTLMRWTQEFRMKPTAPVDTATMATRIDANTKLQMELVKAKLESEARA